jgi:hypothetical protein
MKRVEANKLEYDLQPIDVITEQWDDIQIIRSAIYRIISLETGQPAPQGESEIALNEALGKEIQEHDQ